MLSYGEWVFVVGAVLAIIAYIAMADWIEQRSPYE